MSRAQQWIIYMYTQIQSMHDVYICCQRGLIIPPTSPVAQASAVMPIPGVVQPEQFAMKSEEGVKTGNMGLLLPMSASVSPIDGAFPAEGELRSQPLYHSRGRGSFSGTAYSVPGVNQRSVHHSHSQSCSHGRGKTLGTTYTARGAN